MAVYRVKSRKTGPFVVADVTAATREEAIAQVVFDVAADENVEVFDVQQLEPEPVEVSKK